MKDKDITWDIVNSEYKGKPLFDRYCWFISCCDHCNPRVRFLCKVKCKIREHQEKIITKILNKRGANNDR